MPLASQNFAWFRLNRCVGLSCACVEGVLCSRGMFQQWSVKRETKLDYPSGPVSLFIRMADGTIPDPVADAVKRAKEVRLPFIFLRLFYKFVVWICLLSFEQIAAKMVPSSLNGSEGDGSFALFVVSLIVVVTDELGGYMVSLWVRVPTLADGEFDLILMRLNSAVDQYVFWYYHQYSGMNVLARVLTSLLHRLSVWCPIESLGNRTGRVFTLVEWASVCCS